MGQIDLTSIFRQSYAGVLGKGFDRERLEGLLPDGKKNADIAKQFDVSLDKGVPVIAVAEPDGKVVVSENNGEFEDARQLTPQFMAEFLNKWKANKTN